VEGQNPILLENWTNIGLGLVVLLVTLVGIRFCKKTCFWHLVYTVLYSKCSVIDGGGGCNPAPL